MVEAEGCRAQGCLGYLRRSCLQQINLKKHFQLLETPLRDSKLSPHLHSSITVLNFLSSKEILSIGPTTWTSFSPLIHHIVKIDCKHEFKFHSQWHKWRFSCVPSLSIPRTLFPPPSFQSSWQGWAVCTRFLTPESQIGPLFGNRWYNQWRWGHTQVRRTLIWKDQSSYKEMQVRHDDIGF